MKGPFEKETAAEKEAIHLRRLRAQQKAQNILMEAEKEKDAYQKKTFWRHWRHGDTTKITDG